MLVHEMQTKTMFLQAFLNNFLKGGNCFDREERWEEHISGCVWKVWGHVPTLLSALRSHWVTLVHMIEAWMHDPRKVK